MIVPERVSLITLAARNVAALRTFYQQLGWRETDFSSDYYAVFTTAGVMLTLYPIEDWEKDVGLTVRKNTGEYKPISISINVQEASEVDGIFHHLQAIGGDILQLPASGDNGGRSFYFSDPELHVWEVTYNPTATFDDRGAMLTL